MPLDTPGQPLRPAPAESYPPPYSDAWQRREAAAPPGAAARSTSRPLLHLVLFLATLLTTTFAGSLHHAGFASDFTDNIPAVSFLEGAWFSLTLLAILGAHEFGHYFACRYYGVDATLPYFLPAPLPLTGTVGAVIRIRQPIQSKPVLFDVGAAGPIAGFVVAVPALFLGLQLSRVVALPDDFVGMSLGEPLLFQWASWMTWGDAPSGYTLNLHPVGLAAWLGLLLTALNLFPIGQLDGGHIAYAVLGQRSTAVSVGATVVVVALVFLSASWIIWAALMIAMLVFLGPRHPRTADEHVPLDPTRRLVAALTVAIFVVCFTPAPFSVLDLVAQP